jgi:chromosome segregation ATPase
MNRFLNKVICGKMGSYGEPEQPDEWELKRIEGECQAQEWNSCFLRVKIKNMEMEIERLKNVIDAVESQRDTFSRKCKELEDVITELQKKCDAQALVIVNANSVQVVELNALRAELADLKAANTELRELAEKWQKKFDEVAGDAWINRFREMEIEK